MEGGRQASKQHWGSAALILPSDPGSQLSARLPRAKTAACIKPEEQKGTKGTCIPLAMVTITTHGKVDREWGRAGSHPSRWHLPTTDRHKGPTGYFSAMPQAPVQPWPSFKPITCCCQSRMPTLSLGPETCPFRPITWHFTYRLSKPQLINLQPISFHTTADLKSLINLTG